MSRARKIINMVKGDTSLPESSNPFSKIPSVAVKESVNTETIEEHGNPGAEEISLTLGGIWENVSRDDDEVNETSKSCVDLAEPDKITPFSLEVPSSFENSPMMEMQELVSDSRSIPSRDMELSIQTPIPSPINIHSTCNDEFCPNHDICFSAITSPSINSSCLPGTSQSTRQKMTPRTTKKRQRNQNEWSDVKRKCLKNLGQKYVTKRGKIVNEKTLGPACKCRYKCMNKISHQQRVDCFSKFWQLGDRATQWNFIIRYSGKMKKKRCLNQETPNNRKYTYKYYLPLITDLNVNPCEKVEVCQTMFINTLAVSTKILKTAWKKYDGSVNIEDRRGRHTNHKTTITGSMIQSVCDHVREFTPVESHYIRKNSQKLHLAGDLNIAKMHKLYLEWFDAEKYTDKAFKERQYRDIINANFNLGLHIPKKNLAKKYKWYQDSLE